MRAASRRTTPRSRVEIEIADASRDAVAMLDSSGGANYPLLVKKLCIFIGMTVIGSAGWWLGEKVGFMTAFILSGIGSMAGVYLGWRINRDYFE